MAELWAAFHGAWEVLALGAGAAMPAVLANPGSATDPAMAALLAMLADAGAAARCAIGAPPAVGADAGAAARRTFIAQLAVET